jgi:hypothetical protein
VPYLKASIWRYRGSKRLDAQNTKSATETAILQTWFTTASDLIIMSYSTQILA